MSWQTAAVRYVSIGEKSARFRDLTLPFTGDGEPVETVIWLPNGGGKSSLMSLKSAVVLPSARDFTGAGREDGDKRPRRLDDYVATGDTSHTAIEWVRDEAGSLLGGRHRLLTGAVYEWPERRRPAVEQAVSLNKLWWSAVPADGVLDLATLPVRDGRLLTLSQFHDRLRTLNTEHPELQIQVARTQTQWEKQLDDAGIDTALYRYQARMNTSEGGIAKVFNFNTVRDFIDLVVDVIAAPEQAQDCGNVVSQHAQNLFRRPSLLIERDFLAEARDLLGQLEAAHDLVGAAVADRRQARQDAQRLRIALAHATRVHEIRALRTDETAEDYQRRTTAARTERGRVDGVRAELLVMAAQAEHRQAGEDVERAVQDEGEARVDHSAWAAAAPLAEAAGLDAIAEQLREQLQPERAARLELRERLDAYALAARELLHAQAGALDEEATDARGRAEREAGTRRRLDQAVTQARDEQTVQHRLQAGAKALLDAFEADVAAAHRDGHLERSEQPAAALDRHTGAVTAAEAAAAEHRGREVEYREGSEAAAQDVTAAAEAYAALLSDVRDAAAEKEALQRAHDELAEHPRLLELAEADGRLDVWGEVGRLRRRLDDASRKAQADALRAAVAAAEDTRLVGAVDTTGLLPAPAATLAVADQLADTGVPAETAWAVLARDYPQDARSRVASSRPDIASSVVVQDHDSRDQARRLLTVHPTLAHIPLVTADELAHAAGRADDGGDRPGLVLPAVPLHDGLHVTDAALSAADHLRGLGRIRQDEQDTLTAQAAADRELLGQMTSFLTSYPDADCLVRAARAVTTVENQAQSKFEEKEAAATRRDDRRRLSLEQRAHAEAAEARAAGHRTAVGALKRLVGDGAALQEHRATLASTGAELARLDGEIELKSAQRDEAGERAAAAEREQSAAQNRAGQVRQQMAGIRILDEKAPPPRDVIDQAHGRGLTQCLATYETLDQQWQHESTGSVLEAQLASVEQQAKTARERAQRALSDGAGDLSDGDGSGADRAAVADLARQRADQFSPTTCEDRAVAARRRLDGAIAAVATSRSALSLAKQTLDTALAERRTRQRVAEPVEFTTAQAAREQAGVLAARVTDLTTQETELTRRRDEARGEVDTERKLAEDLKDAADHLPALDGEAAAATSDVPPFDGDLAEARAQVRAATARLDRAEAELTAARDQRAEYSRQALKLATAPAYQSLALTLRDRLQDGNADRLGEKAAEYAEQVATRLDHVQSLLVQIGQDEVRVSQLVATHVRQLLSNLQAANRASLLPAGLGELSGKRFINLRFNDPSDEELASRVTESILTMLDAAHGETKSLPSGETVLRRCVHAAAGAKGFRVEVLKPNEHMVEQRVPVVDVARFSDGEKLTTCVLLFCAFARMRQQGRTGGATGTLMLDNPFGRASNAQLVALQLAVAKAQRVHLVYATGLEDMGALLQFRRLIRLRNRKPVGSTDGHVQLDQGVGRVGEVTGVSVSRPAAPVPAGLNEVPDTRGEAPAPGAAAR
jgi:hypothetical protein